MFMGDHTITALRALDIPVVEAWGWNMDDAV